MCLSRWVAMLMGRHMGRQIWSCVRICCAAWRYGAGGMQHDDHDDVKLHVMTLCLCVWAVLGKFWHMAD
eukprot:CAMPEP_0202917580 /NCGR_PEP_ID=MMETSP1392-20130828/71318_1 /ASSEMBLY_ACC=CAM_ASM_000868 /TAXON_ID=225041 /ORGANISM="Chlamydomonas chlamydogama, Strain SAG 11-48b" /LENGTH=68 /DNA_ID=CAMNT_0049610367 /DNA_START=55 /DNA_END=261 /DNA_ORIENTATION=+